MCMLTRLFRLVRVLAYLASHADVIEGVLVIDGKDSFFQLGDGIKILSSKTIQLNGEYVLVNCHPEFVPCPEIQDSPAIDQSQMEKIDC
jgi:hypothetical protein